MGDAPAAGDHGTPRRRDLAQAIIELSQAGAALMRGQPLGSADLLMSPGTPQREPPRLLELAAALVRALTGAPWAVACAREQRELEAVTHFRRHGTSEEEATTANEVSGPVWDGEVVPPEPTVIAAVDPAALGMRGRGPIGPLWVAPFAFEPAGRGWLALPWIAGAGEVDTHGGVPRDVVALATHLGMALGQVLLARVARTTRTMYRTLVEQLPAVTYYRRLDTPGAASFISPQMLELTGFSADDWQRDPGLWRRQLHPEDRVWVLPDQALYSPAESTRPLRREYRLLHRDGRVVWIENTALAVRDDDGRARFVMGVMFDITERKALEASLREAQKLEAIGKLAGGVAHDFNNLLSVILGWVAELQAETPVEDRRARALGAIGHAAEKARVLTHKLLAFGRRQMLELRPMRLDALVGGLEGTLQKLAGEGVAIELRLSEVDLVRVDPGQIEQVLLNLVANARDAMPRGGRVEVAVFPAPPALAEGSERGAVCMAVRDEGSGLDEVTRARIFEPFFTTKERTRNTGLGLSTSLGIVQQCGGRIEVQSQPGQGATFTVVLPACAEVMSEALAALRAETTPPASARRVMVVEEDEQIRRLLVMLLGRLGHRVSDARDAATALTRIAADGLPDLVICDVAARAAELPTVLRAQAPELPFMFVSDLTDATVARAAELRRAPILRKPFSMKSLVAALDEALRAKAGDP